jgi:hypothetical protein
MYYYFCVIFLISFVALVVSLKPEKSNGKSFVIFSFTLIIIFQSIRKWTVGIDIVTYLSFFEQLGSGSVKNFSELYSGVETGFLYYNKLIATFTSDHQIFLGIVSASIFIPIAYVIYKNSSNSYLSIIYLITLGIYNFTFSGIRQSLAIGITFLSYEFIKSKQWVRFLLIILLASTFHKSAFVFLPAYLLYNIKIEKKHFILVLGIISVIFIFKSFLLKFLISSTFEKYSSSISSESTGAYTMFLVMLTIYTASILVQGKTKDPLSLNAFSNFMLVAVVIQISASESQVSMRAGYYYYLFTILLLPEIITAFDGKKVQNTISAISVILCLTFYYIITNATALNPFTFYWE